MGGLEIGRTRFRKDQTGWTYKISSGPLPFNPSAFAENNINQAGGEKDKEQCLPAILVGNPKCGAEGQHPAQLCPTLTDKESCIQDQTEVQLYPSVEGAGNAPVEMQPCCKWQKPSDFTKKCYPVAPGFDCMNVSSLVICNSNSL